MDLENAEEILQILERYTKQRSKTIPDELNSYLTHVALTGDSVYSWSKVQYFFREKLAHVIKDFHDTTPRTEDLPVSRNVDAFNYDSLKTMLLERFDLFNAAPFTIQRLSELLNEPKKHYCRLDKFMRALEKNILVVSTVEPGHRQMGSENGDSINGDPLMDINVDVEMDKEPSSSNVPPIEKKIIEAQPEPNVEVTSTENKTDEGTSEKRAEPINDDAKVSTNGHHNNELEEKIVEDPKANDEQIVESSDKTDSTTVVETIKVEVQPTELGEKENSPEVITDVSTQASEASQTTTDIEPTKESTVDVDKRLDENDAESYVLPLTKASKEIIVEKTQQNIPEGAKHLLDDDIDEDCQPTAAKLIKMEEVSNVEAEVVADVAKSDEVPAEIPTVETISDHQPTSEDKEIVSEPVLVDDNAALPSAPVDEQPIIQTNDEKTVADAETVAAENKIVEKQLDVDVIAPIPTDVEHVQPDTIDETNNDTISTDTTISPLASTISNDLDILEEDEEDDLIEPIVADAEQNILEPATLAEPDVEMLSSIDNPEQMAVEDPTPVLASSNSDSAMDATQIIPPSTDEQMDVLENNLMDEDL